MRHLLTASVASLALVGAAAVPAIPALAKSCRSGYTHAVINGSE